MNLELLFTVCEEVGPARCAGVRRLDAEKRLGLRLRPRVADRRDHRRVADALPLRRPTFTASPRTRASGRRRAAARSSPPRAPSPRCGWGASTRRRPRTSPGSRAASRAGRTSSPSAAGSWGRCARSIPAKAESLMAELIGNVHDAANTPACACDVDVTTEKLFDGYRQQPNAPAVAAAEKALLACGYKPMRRSTGGGSDANAFEAAGLALHEHRQRHRAQPRAARARQRRGARGHARRDVRAAGRMLRLRRATVLVAGPPTSMEQRLSIELDGIRRSAIADVGLVGAAQEGDELIVNVEAVELGLGSGGFDVVHVNLTRGLDGAGTPRAHVMKLNYTSLQHAVLPVEEGDADGVPAAPELPIGRPVAVLALHGQLAPLAFAFARAKPGGRARLRADRRRRAARRALVRRARAARRRPARRPPHRRPGVRRCGRRVDHDRRRTAPRADGARLGRGRRGAGPGILGSGSALGHGGLQALDSAHTALALGCETVLVARMSSTDLRARHRGLSHHTRTVLDLLLAPVTVAVPAGAEERGRRPASTRGSRAKPTSTPISRRRCRRARWAARTRCSSPPRSPPERSSREMSDRAQHA